MDMVRSIKVNDILPQAIRYLTSATDSLASSSGPDSPAFPPAKSPGESSTDPAASTAGPQNSQDSPKLPKESQKLQNPATATSETPLLDRMVRIANMFNVDSYFGIEDFSISEYLEKPEKPEQPANDSQDTETPSTESTVSSTILDSIVKNVNSYFGINEPPIPGNPSELEEESTAMEENSTTLEEEPKTMEEKLKAMEETAAQIPENPAGDDSSHCLDLCCWNKEGGFMGKEGAEEGLEEFCKQQRHGMLLEAEGQVVYETTTRDNLWSLLGEKEDIMEKIKQIEGNMMNEL